MSEAKYRGEHRTERARWAPLVATGTVECRRGPSGCRAPNLLISPDDEWDLGHPDAACSAPTAPEHRHPCNRATMSHRTRLPEVHPAVLALRLAGDDTPGGHPSPHP